MSLKRSTAHLTLFSQGDVQSMRQRDDGKKLREEMIQKQKERVDLQKKKRKMIFRIEWGVNPYRQDKRTGPITVHPRDKYTSTLMEEETKRIRGTD